MSSSHTCPWWFAPTFDNPLRWRIHDPQQILGDLVQAGQTVIDIGCGMGYFTLGLARLVGPGGLVVAADLQPEMLDGLTRRVQRTGLLDRVRIVQSTAECIAASGVFDFALAFWMVHEVRNQAAFLRQVDNLLKPGGKFLLVEPKLHVSSVAFEKTVALARAASLCPVALRKVRLSRAVLFEKGVPSHS